MCFARPTESGAAAVSLRRLTACKRLCLLLVQMAARVCLAVNCLPACPACPQRPAAGPWIRLPPASGNSNDVTSLSPGRHRCHIVAVRFGGRSRPGGGRPGAGRRLWGGWVLARKAAEILGSLVRPFSGRNDP